MALGDTLTLPPGCSCCGGGSLGCTCPGSVADALCVTVSGFPESGSPTHPSPVGSQLVWYNGRYRLNLVDGLDGFKRWHMAPAAAPGGDGCVGFASASVVCHEDRVIVRLGLMIGWPSTAEMVYQLDVPHAPAPAGCATIQVSGAATWRSLGSEFGPQPRPDYAPVSVSVTVTTEACAVGTGGVRYNASCPDLPPLIYDPAPAPYPPFMYATYARAPIGPSSDPVDGAHGGDAPGPPNGDADGKTIRFALMPGEGFDVFAGQSPCVAVYRWCGTTAWHNYNDYDAPGGYFQTDDPVEFYLVWAGGSVSWWRKPPSPFFYPETPYNTGGATYQNCVFAYACGGQNTQTGPPNPYGDHAFAWVSYGLYESFTGWVRPGRACWAWYERFATAYAIRSATNAAETRLAYSVTVSASEPAGATLVASTCDPAAAAAAVASAPAGEAAGDAPPARGPCDHLGDAVGGREASRLSLAVDRLWRPCARGHGTRGHICQCDGATCEGCPDWAASGD